MIDEPIQICSQYTLYSVIKTYHWYTYVQITILVHLRLDCRISTNHHVLRIITKFAYIPQTLATVIRPSACYRTCSWYQPTRTSFWRSSSRTFIPSTWFNRTMHTPARLVLFRTQLFQNTFRLQVKSTFPLVVYQARTCLNAQIAILFLVFVSNCQHVAFNNVPQNISSGHCIPVGWCSSMILIV